jgi:hypothetical protein
LSSEPQFGRPRGFGLVLKNNEEQGLAVGAPTSGQVAIIQARTVFRYSFFMLNSLSYFLNITYITFCGRFRDETKSSFANGDTLIASIDRTTSMHFWSDNEYEKPYTF